MQIFRVTYFLNTQVNKENRELKIIVSILSLFMVQLLIVEVSKKSQIIKIC